MIRHSKGPRVVPIRADLVEELRRYITERQQLVHRRLHVAANPEALFLRLDGSPLTVNSGSQAIRRLLRALGLKAPRRNSTGSWNWW
jgi:integrase